MISQKSRALRAVRDDLLSAGKIYGEYVQDVPLARYIIAGLFLSDYHLPRQMLCSDGADHTMLAILATFSATHRSIRQGC